MYCSKQGNCTELSCCKMDTQKEIADKSIYKIFSSVLFTWTSNRTYGSSMTWSCEPAQQIVHMISQPCSFLIISSPHESVTQFGHIWSKLLNSTSWIWWNRYVQWYILCTAICIILLLKVPQLSYHHGCPVWPHKYIVLVR